MRVLVTGGNRYIGLDLVFELARRGHEVTLINSHVAPIPDGARRIHADRRIPGEFEKALGPLRDAFDAVFDNTAFVPSDKALRDVDWAPRFGIEDGFRDSYACYTREGRVRYSFDFAADDALLAQLGR